MTLWLNYLDLIRFRFINEVDYIMHHTNGCMGYVGKQEVYKS